MVLGVTARFPKMLHKDSKKFKNIFLFSFSTKNKTEQKQWNFQTMKKNDSNMLLLLVKDIKKKNVL